MQAAVVNKWFAVDVLCGSEAVDSVEDAINELDSLGIEIDLLAKKKDEPIRVTAYFDELPARDEIDNALAECAATYSLEISTREVEDLDWLVEWKKQWKPTEIANFVIAPPWEEVRESEKILIVIEPNMAFGTGTHATTQLCLAAISQDYKAGQSFLDVGCGTGILSIAAAKVGAVKLVACDTDEASIRIARENAALNGVAESISFFVGTLDDSTAAAAFVVANVILPMLNLLLSKSKYMLVLSGILADERAEIERALATREVYQAEISVSGEWISLKITV
ncbi:MAG: 50S ribosomal protein L11 methyltransferase [Blastocatellia bacterium]|nr:50S ribosomal protein L11 methyltransferase [Blastocatellia bacterium]